MQDITISIGGYNVTSIVMLFIGAGITAFCSYFVSIRRERKHMRKKIEIDTANDLHIIIKEFLDISQIMKTPLIFHINSYNIRIKNRFEVQQDNLYSLLNNWEENYEIYHNKLFSILLYIEFREIVLFKFRIFHSEIIEKYTTLNKTKQGICQSNLIIMRAISNKEEISEDLIHGMVELLKEFENTLYAIELIMIDMQIGMQNELYKKIFNNRIPIRKPLDSNSKVLAPKKQRKGIYG